MTLYFHVSHGVASRSIPHSVEKARPPKARVENLNQ